MQISSSNSAPSAYRVLAEQVRMAGLLRHRPWIYSARIIATIAGLAAGWAALFVVGDAWSALGVAAFLGLVSTHVVFLGHEAGHQQIASSRRVNRLIGLAVGNLLTGLSFGWWVPKHNAHHSHPNQVGRDPDIGIDVVDSIADDSVVRPSHAGRAQRVAHVALSAPLLFLEVGMHLSSVKALAQRRDRGAALEWLLLTVHAAIYLCAVFLVLSPLRALSFIAIQQGLFGLYLRLCFAPNHKGMPIIERDVEMEFAQRQVMTSRNLTGGRFVTFMLGGLNYQIEHHLFPTMPRPNLVRAQSTIRAFCAEAGLEYRQDSLRDSYREAVRYLRTGHATRIPSQDSPALRAASA
jgi:fatty acid desaturase